MEYDEANIVEALQDGVTLFEALCFMEPTLFEKTKIIYEDDDSFQAYKNYSKILEGVTKKYK